MHKFIIGGVLVAALAMVGWVGVASAHSFRSGDSVTIGQDEKIDQTLFAAGRSVDINTEVFGDVFCAGQTVNVNATVHGDVICAGQTVTVNGDIDGDIRLAGQTVTVGVKVTGNATVGSQTFVLDSDGAIKGDLSVGGADATVNGPVGRDVALGGMNATLTSKVGRDVKGSIEHLSLTSTARVAGSIDYVSNQELSKGTDTVVGGKISRTTPPSNEQQRSRSGGLGWAIYWVCAMLLFAMVIALFFPQALQRTTQHGLATPWKTFIVGFVASFAAPIAIVVALLTVIGIPLAIFMTLAWIVVVMLGGPVFAYLLGRLVFQKPRSALLTMLAGAGITTVISLIPFVAFFTFLAGLWYGTGMILLEVFRRTPKPVYTPAEAETAKK